MEPSKDKNMDFRKKLAEGMNKGFGERVAEAGENLKQDIGVSSLRRKAAEEEVKRKAKPGY